MPAAEKARRNPPSGLGSGKLATPWDRMHCASSSCSDWLDSPVDPGLLDKDRPLVVPLEIAGTELVYETVVAMRAAELGEAHVPVLRTVPADGPGPYRPGDGVGLGLSIVQAVASSHGAEVDVTSRNEGGLAITISFPPVPAGAGNELPRSRAPSYLCAAEGLGRQ